jgi:hypothetical protein
MKNNIILPSKTMQIPIEVQILGSDMALKQWELFLIYLDKMVLENIIDFASANLYYCQFCINSEDQNYQMLQELENIISGREYLVEMMNQRYQKNSEEYEVKIFMDNLSQDGLLEDAFRELYESPDLDEETKKQLDTYFANFKVLAGDFVVDNSLEQLSEALKYKAGRTTKALTVEELIKKVENNRDAKKIQNQQINQAIASIKSGPNNNLKK